MSRKWAIILVLIWMFVGAHGQQLGDLYTFPDGSQGVVYYLLPDGSGGWVVALNDVVVGSTNKFRMSVLSNWEVIPFDSFAVVNPSVIQASGADTAGYLNTLFLKEHSSEAAMYVNIEQGWYIPAAAQLKKLYSYLPFVESALSQYGTTLHSDVYSKYWSSTLTTTGNSQVFGVFFSNGTSSSDDQSATHYVRPVRSFTFPSVYVDTTLTYLWSTGSTEPYITPSPSQTTTYTVTATNELGCSSTASQTIYVASGPSQVVEDVVCADCDYEGYGFSISADEYPYPGTFTYSRTVMAEGCSTEVVLHLTVLPRYSHAYLTQEACGFYTWNGVTYYESGIYEQTFPAEGQPCDATYTLDLTLLPPDTTYLTISTCDSYTLNDITYLYTGNYVQNLTNANGCDSVIMLNLTILPSQYVTIDTTVCDELVWDDVIYTESGVYTLNYQNHNGCDSIVTLQAIILHSTTTTVDSILCDNLLPMEWNGLTFHSAGTQTVTLQTEDGCDSVVTMTLHVNQTHQTQFAEVACDFYTWNDQTYTQSGTYVQEFSNQQGCDSVVTLTLTINPSHVTSFDTTVCNSFVWNGETYTATGMYEQTLQNQYGCDSVVTADVTVHYADTVQVDTVVCPQNLPVTVRGFTFTETGTQTVTVPNVHGCDSTTTVHVDVSDTVTVIANVTACDLYPWYDTVCAESGTYIRVIPNSDGCAQTRRLQLTIYHSDTVYVDSTCCQNQLPLVWNGLVFLASGTQSRTLQNRYNCDSVVVMTVHVNSISFTPFDTTVCGQFEWNGEVFTQSGNYPRTFTNALGCDSVVFAKVTVIPPPSTVIDTTVCSADLPVNWHGYSFEHTDTLTFAYTSSLGCDSTVTMVLHEEHPDTVVQSMTACDIFEWDGDEYMEDGTITKMFTNAHGCDSVVTIHLTIHSSQHHQFADTVCGEYVWNGETYTETGEYEQTFTDVNGCDSVVTLQLSISDTYQLTEERTVCADSLPYTWNGVTFNVAGTQSITMQSVDGCDSVVTMILHVSDTYQLTQERTVCADSLPYTWNGVTFTEAGTQSLSLQTAGGCDSVVTMILHVSDTYQLTQERTVCADSMPYAWNGVTFTEAGTQSLTMQTVDGCDSVITMTLQVSDNYQLTEERSVCADSLPYTWNGVTFTEAATQSITMQTVDGCDSVITMTLQVSDSYQLTEERTVCADSLPYTWNGMTFTEAGTQSITMQTVDGCDSVVTMILHVSDTYQLTQERTVCADSLPYAWNGTTFTEAGTQSVTLQTADGCDSVITMTLQVSDIYQMTEERTVCANSLPYTWNGVTFNAAGIQSITMQTVDGCDSVITMTLQVSDSYQMNQGRTICADSLPYTWNGVAFNSAGTQSITLQTADGCDSVITMTLQVSDSYQMTEERTVCADLLPYTWNGVAFNSAGTQLITMQTVNGCDSTIMMTLSVSSIYQLTEEYSVCEDRLPYLWNGVTFMGPDTQTVTLQSVDGCDSVVTMALVVKSLDTTELNETSCDVFEWDGETYTSSGDYTHVLTNMQGCDSVVILHLTVNPTVTESVEVTACEIYQWNGETLSETGDYERQFENVYGCDSIVTLHLTVIDTMLQIISLTEDFCEGMSAELAVVTEMTDFLWSTGENLPNITVTQPGIYSVTAMQGGCRATARYTVEACDFQLWLPNAITPSKSDGLNDVFSLPQRAQSMINKFEISIFNRWGEQVFYSTDKNFRWDGSVQGRTFTNAVYTYIIRYTLTGGKPYRITGSVTVL